MLGRHHHERENTLTYSYGGHLNHLPVLYCEGQARYLEGQGSAVGVVCRIAVYQDHVIHLPSNLTDIVAPMGQDARAGLPGWDYAERKRNLQLPRLVEGNAGTVEALIGQVENLQPGKVMPDDISLMT